MKRTDIKMTPFLESFLSFDLGHMNEEKFKNKIKDINYYDDLKLEFSDNINIIIGNNGEGKTNILESVYVLSLTKSNRYGVDVENYIVIKNDEKDDDIRYVNEHVSSYHAKIVYDNEGFFLHAEEGGLGHTRLKHKNSKEWYTLRTEIGVPLYDGDHVKLGSVDHYILLRFKIN